MLENKLHSDINNNWTNYSRIYKAGERVSKVLDEAFKNKNFNMRYSDIIAKNMVKGVIDISIDPIEILLMSCNVSGWTSCHTIHDMNGRGINYGCYSAGIFSYMCDNVSLIAYRHDGKLYDFKIGKQKIQAKSKNWRQMLYVREDMKVFIASRQYPMNSEEITMSVREMLEECIDEYTEQKTWVHTSTEKGTKVKDIIADKAYKSYIEPLHYNDISHGFRADMCYHKDMELKEDSLEIGSFPVCPICGEKLLTNSNSPYCGCY